MKPSKQHLVIYTVGVVTVLAGFAMTVFDIGNAYIQDAVLVTGTVLVINSYLDYLSDLHDFQKKKDQK